MHGLGPHLTVLTDLTPHTLSVFASLHSAHRTTPNCLSVSGQTRGLLPLAPCDMCNT